MLAKICSSESLLLRRMRIFDTLDCSLVWSSSSKSLRIDGLCFDGWMIDCFGSAR